MQVAQKLAGDIISGKLAPGSKLPGSREMAVSFSINPNTAARVYQELESRRLCETRRGLGTFVTTDGECIRATREQAAREILKRYRDALKALGYTHEQAIALLGEETEHD